ncbi:MAG: DNA repair protein RecO [Faecalibacterium sp.]|nr:DNA repair protein RecO [Faecalibacterium sp.]
MDPIVTTGLVLRETKYKESDRILAILSPQLGVISAAAKGSLRLKNKLFSACGLFCYSEFTLYPGKNMYTVDDAEVKTVFHGLSESVERMSLAMYLGEIALMLSPTGAEADTVLRLLLNSLYLAGEGKMPLKQIKAVYELRLCGECGFLPQLLCCKACGLYDGKNFYLDEQDGELLCADCAAKAGKKPNLDPGALYAVRHICLADEKKIFGFRISEESGKKLAAVAERYALVHLDSIPKSYAFLKTVL